jgi:hypothetical protein
MPLVKIIRHGFEFWEAPCCANPPLPDLQEPVSRTSRLLATNDYRKRSTPRGDEPNITAIPSIPEEVVNIQSALIEAFGISSDDFHGRCRTEHVANARIASMALCRAYTTLTVEEIAEAHNRHHRVVCHASYRFVELQNDPAFVANVAKIECSLLQKAA